MMIRQSTSRITPRERTLKKNNDSSKIETKTESRKNNTQTHTDRNISRISLKRLEVPIRLITKSR